jgi:PEP-CTERM motif-containing protein
MRNTSASSQAMWVGLALLAVASGALAATYTSDGSGDWDDPNTWDAAGIPATAFFRIRAGDTVTADGVTLSSLHNTEILGTWNIEGSSTFGVNRLNYGLDALTPGAAIINISDGSSLTAAVINRSTTLWGVTVNVNDGGYLKTTDAIALYNSGVVNVNVGGTYEPTWIWGNVNLHGGTIIHPANSTAYVSLTPANWSGGTLIVNPGTSATVSNGVGDDLALGLTNHAGNILDLSNQASKQRLSFQDSDELTISQGTIQFNVYSSTDDDSDFMHAWMPSLGSGSHVVLEDGVPLTGVAADYIGSSYDLLQSYNLAALTIAPTVDTPIWNIGGQDYTVSFTNNLATDGTLVVGSLTLVPEPATMGLLALGGVALLKRRR